MNENTDLPKEVVDFKPQTLIAPHKEAVEKGNVELIRLQASDYEWRIRNRGRYGFFIVMLLSLQNIFVAIMIIVAYHQGCLADIQWLMGVFFTTVMVQTYFTANRVITWLFTDIDYKIHKLH